ncbi:DUF3794 domain-containing protein [Pelosinus sp. IPA-1]|uniref:DUF3794 domain-containing protein n=1 Tax=Pelosinus sp. IPA-1 TaxID=3029569 RepID=UPI0024361DBC|nr:DUF3794 domain-containing protein [Pelosinus sp. IPA-1]GMB01389.1 hypothetical protein PIPA1_41880 [Pelosinus sp. IPA-1]
MDDKDIRQNYNPCTLGVETGPQNIIVRQVIGEAEKQKVLDIHVVVPDTKPAVEQIIDVFVKNLEINCVDVIYDKIIVRGEFEIKTIYVADLPNNPVHAIEIKHYRWTQDIDMPGARRGMDADASVFVEFVDYDVDEWSRAYKYKYGEMDCDDDDKDCDDDCYDDDDDCDDDDDHHHHDHDNHNCHDPHNCNDHKHHKHHHHHHCSREFDISIVLKIIGKVIADREVQIGGGGSLPTKPKG